MKRPLMAAAAPASNYRPEIQGLRTIGALLVAIYHIWFNRVSGGVDVFFVISGYLITGSLSREFERSGRLGVIAFWGRIATRVAPVAYPVLFGTVLAALVCLPETRWAGLLDEVFYSAFHLENLKLMDNAVDYLARDEPPSVLQQFWALSVQVQFYCIWPFVVMLSALLRSVVRSAAGAIAIVIITVIIFSFIYSVYSSNQSPSSAYFDPFSRIWEFALGGLAAIALPHLAISRRAQICAGWAGLLAIVSCGIVLPSSVHFPGYAALWPTIGAVLVLISGNPRSPFAVQRVLSWRPLVRLGGISFTFYLLHWPLLAILLTYKARATRLDGLLIIAAALCGAWLVKRWFEQPFERWANAGPGIYRPFALAVAFATPLLIVAGVWTVVIRRAEDAAFNAAASAYARSDHPGGAVAVSTKRNGDPAVPLLLPPAQVKRDLPKSYSDRCFQRKTSNEVIVCDYGVLYKPNKVIALVGGSHSAHWLPALEILAEEHRWHIVNITKNACALGLDDAREPSCIVWNEQVIGVLSQIHPDVVFTTSTRRREGVALGARPSREVVPEGYKSQWSLLAKSGISVIAVRDNPWMELSPPECVEANLTDLTRCVRTRRELIDDASPTGNLKPKPTNVSFIDLTDRFCDQVGCPAVNGNVIIYRDRTHLTASYVRTLAPILGTRMKTARPDLFEGQPLVPEAGLSLKDSDD